MEPTPTAPPTPTPIPIPASGGKRVNGMGIASVALGILACLFSIIPFCGLIPAIGLSIIGAVLGLVGLLAAISDKRTGVGFPIVGMAICVAAVIFGILWTVIVLASAGEAARQQQQYQQTWP